MMPIPFDKGMYEYLMTSNVFRMMGPGYVPFAPPAYPLERSFDKLQFRSVTETGGEYVLVDGFSRGNRPKSRRVGCVSKQFPHSSCLVMYVWKRMDVADGCRS